ncbi:glycoside hydrolase family 5 protein [Favolaschia claudopus]|uniref:glucan 1,3-beta-glucosidase n=1 Tax=Favolaschia claudopus TaxID=2862362 RepID=A0AAW0AWB3_9AGAR
MDPRHSTSSDPAEGTYSDFIPPSRPFAPSSSPAPQAGSVRSSHIDTSSIPDNEPYRDDPTNRGSDFYPPPSPNNSTALLPGVSSAPRAAAAYGTYDSSSGAGKRGGSKRRVVIVSAIVALIVLILAVVLPVYFLVVRKHNNDSAAASSGSGDSGANGNGGDGDSNSSNPKSNIVVGGDGSTVTTDSGETFVYKNQFGGYWVSSDTDPFHPSVAAQPNSWTPPLNQTWQWGKDRVYGVNLGGWFVLEPFIAPALFQAYPSASDEWSLSALMRADGTLKDTMEKHYATFITEKDIAQIASAGLNWVRLPIPFWAVSTWSDVGVDSNGKTQSEPFLEGVAWPYIVRLLHWARKYGIRVNLDLHAVPGSQNGYNHSGKSGQINFLNGIMGIANAQRTLDYIRIITEFVSQPEWQDVVQMFGIVNEARPIKIGMDQMSAFYLEAHNMMRSITGIGKGPYISMHDGFMGLSKWEGFLPGADRMVIDTHPYFAFSGNKQTSPIATGTDPNDAGGQWPGLACNSWGSSLNNSRKAFGVTIAGEFSNGYNDCGLYLQGVNGTTSYGGNCVEEWEDSSKWTAETKAGVKAFALASMDALGDWFFWTWKIGPALDGVVRSPLWSYQLGLENGWMPTDPRQALGKCASIGIKGSGFSGQFKSWQTGGAGAGTISPDATQAFGDWPPRTLTGYSEDEMSLLPTYTATGSIPTLTYTTPAASGSATPTVSVGNGWADASDTQLVATAVAGCTYPAAWGAANMPVPTARC